MEIIVSKEFHDICPEFKGAAILAEVTNSKTSLELWQKIQTQCKLLQQQYTSDSIKTKPGIEATRKAYRLAGKDPSRYRPACEQLARRVLQKKDLYSIDTIVDIGNLVSLFSGYATAMLDANKINGDTITLRLGTDADYYEGIGRGILNISSLPTYSDSLGGIATPTSDSIRTKVTDTTHKILMLINGFDGNSTTLNNAVELALNLLKEHTQAVIINHWIYQFRD